jgi:hypothetical protein
MLDRWTACRQLHTRILRLCQLDDACQLRLMEQQAVQRLPQSEVQPPAAPALLTTDG